jgi:hypothetical protein
MSTGTPRRLSLTKALTPKANRTYNKLDDYEFSSPNNSPIPMKRLDNDESLDRDDDNVNELTEIDLDFEEKVYQQKLLESPPDKVLACAEDLFICSLQRIASCKLFQSKSHYSITLLT